MTIKITSATFHACVTNKAAIPDDNLPIVALVGRSNVGKSSLINALCGRKELARTSSLPGKTLTINFYLINEAFYIVDLPGYGYAKASKVTRQKIQAMMNEFFGECNRLKGVIQILDVRHKPSALDVQMFSWIRDQKFNYLAVLTKMDKLSNQQGLKMRKEILRDIKVDFALTFSAKTKAGKDEFLDALEKITSGADLGIPKPAPAMERKRKPKNQDSNSKDKKDPNRRPPRDNKRTKDNRPQGGNGPRPERDNKPSGGDGKTGNSGGNAGSSRRRRPPRKRKDPAQPEKAN